MKPITVDTDAVNRNSAVMKYAIPFLVMLVAQILALAATAEVLHGASPTDCAMAMPETAGACLNQPAVPADCNMAPGCEFLRPLPGLFVGDLPGLSRVPTGWLFALAETLAKPVILKVAVPPPRC